MSGQTKYEFNINYDDEYYIVIEPLDNHIIRTLETNGFPHQDGIFLCNDPVEARRFLKQKYKENLDLV